VLSFSLPQVAVVPEQQDSGYSGGPMNALPRTAGFRKLAASVNPALSSTGEEPVPLFDPILELHSLLSGPRVELRRVGELIRRMPEVATLALQLSDFLMLERHEPADSIEQAAVLLGAERLRVLVLSSAILGLQRMGLDEPPEFARHCLTSALWSDRIARFARYAHPEFACLAGFLHSMGRIGSLRFCEWDRDRAVADSARGNANARLDISWDLGPVLSQIFEHQRDERGVRLDAELIGIVVAGCQLSQNYSVVGGSPAQRSARETYRLLAQCLPRLQKCERAKLVEVIAADRRDLVPFLEFVASVLAERGRAWRRAEMGRPSRGGHSDRTVDSNASALDQSNAWVRLLENATREVFEIILETHIECSGVQEEPDVAVTAIVGIGGQAAGVLIMRVSGEAAERIAKNLFARDRSKPPLDPPTSVAEICHKIAANFKSKLGSVGDRCELSAPVVVTGSAAQCRAVASSESLRVSVVYQEQPISITLDIE
jgi:CheY-specific phosphatase CheX/HD-like signal output (HDOD) protein